MSELREQTLQERTAEISREYWEARETQSERVAVAQLCLALARTERTDPVGFLVADPEPDA